MVERRVCSFCGDSIEPGTGKMFVKKDGTTFQFCTNKCQKNMLKLKRVPRKTKWSRRYEKAPAVEAKKKIKKRPKPKVDKAETAEEKNEEGGGEE